MSDLNNAIKDTLTNTFVNQIKIKGELSNIKLSGPHTYLTLKDENSSVNVVAWSTKYDHLKNGDDVMVTGKLACFLKHGTYQINSTKIDRIGVGALHETLEHDKKSFDKKGYFSKSKNSVCPPSKINRVGILTASEGAALQDILYVLKTNLFCGEVYVKNCSVQGQLCPSSVANGIDYFNELNKKKPIDILIIGRGGGSFEDLIGYSSKEVVKAIYKTNIYTISAVGHEVDTMLSDYAANYRAPTPSIAGEVISTVQKKEKELLNKNLEHILRIKLQIKSTIESCKEKINHNTKILKTIDPVNFLNTELDKLSRTKTFVYNKVFTNMTYVVSLMEKYKMKNESFDPSKVFEGGYVAIVDEDNNLINKLDDFNTKINTKQKLKIVFTDGEIEIPISISTSASKKHVKK